MGRFTNQALVPHQRSSMLIPATLSIEMQGGAPTCNPDTARGGVPLPLFVDQTRIQLHNFVM